MLKKPLRRVKRRKGAVLFAVISIMALLIAMASTAYFTAKSAYNSVISNYSYSQLYLSAVSVSDMILDAVINDSMPTASADNHYQSLRDAVINNLTNVNDTIYAYSPNITVDVSTSTREQIIDQLTNAEPTVQGVLDGVVVEIKFTEKGPDRYDASDPNNTSTNKLYAYDCTYTFTTTAYYRGDSIEVEDLIKTTKFRRWTQNPGSNGSNGLIVNPDEVKVIPGSGGGGGGFSTFFTATGQELGEGSITRTSRTVKINTLDINDDAFFQNTSTFFGKTQGGANNNTFKGGITSTGSVYLEHFKTDIQGADNDWWIGDDLVITNNDAKTLNLGSENSLYVGDDLVLAANAEITAKDIYVEGDLYVLGYTNITGNVHVSGNIYYEMGDTIIDEKGNLVDSPKKIAESNDVYFTNGSLKHTNPGATNGFDVTGDVDINGKVILPSDYDGVADIAGNTISSGASASTDSNSIGTYDPSSTTVIYTNKIADANDEDGDGNTDEFISKPNTGTVSSAINSQVGTNVPYYNYTSPATALQNEVVVDLSLIKNGKKTDGDGNILCYDYTDPNTGVRYYADYQQDNLTNCKDVTITLPPYSKYSYVDAKTGKTVSKGYVLDIKADSLNTVNGNATVNYEIPTSGDANGAALPIVLKNNIVYDYENNVASEDDGDKLTDKEVKGFSWQGTKVNDESFQTRITAIGDGNVVFEMANLDEKGNLVVYDSTKDSDIEVVTYVSGNLEMVGNEKQQKYITNLRSEEFKDDIAGMYANEPVPKEGYFNQFMLVSNMNDGLAVDGDKSNNLFCGYVYAPNGVFSNMGNGQVAPVFGGMIVSTYNSKQSNFYYAEPKPSVISSMLGNLVSGNGGNGSSNSTTIVIPGNVESWSIEGTPPSGGAYTDCAPVNGKYDWNFKGSNFVG